MEHTPKDTKQGSIPDSGKDPGREQPEDDLTPKDKKKNGLQESKGSVMPWAKACLEASKRMHAISNTPPPTPEREKEILSPLKRGMTAIFIPSPPKRKPEGE